MNENYTGGFDSRKHPIYIEDAQLSADKNFIKTMGNRPDIGSTEVHQLAKSILIVMRDKIRAAKRYL